ncbi:phage portal protein [Erwinia sp. E602]|uniref:phage portal protein n=1 Tax=Erwinia sp. E602 TaxID=2675378 RepID=UPI001BACC3EC|nr:phage portal protein [Erwinia sp. E602]QUG75865.1 phage portal protein [Erwinia sp. E602]
MSKKNGKGKREQLVSNPTMKRELQSIRTSQNSVRGLGLGAAYIDYNLNAMINTRLQSLVIESRTLVTHNPIANKYCRESANAVAGADGIYIRPNITMYEDENENIKLSQELERRFDNWSEDPAAFDICGSLNFASFQNLLEYERASTGECFVRIHKRDTGLYVELIQGSRVPINNNKLLDDGRYVSNGIEFSPEGKPIAYYISRYNPSTYSYEYSNPERVEASEILHYFIPQQAKQERGLPDILPGKELLRELDSFLEASLITKKIGSAVMAFIENDLGNKDEDNVDLNQGVPNYFENETLEPGSIVELNAGQTLKDFNPKAATDGVKDYVDQQLTLIAISLGITKQSLTGDTAGASYSAARLSDKIQLNTYQTRINQLKYRVLKPLYRIWLSYELLNNNDLGLSFSDFDSLLEAQYHSQRQVSLDPLKDAQYETLLLSYGLKSKAEIIAESGRDPAVIFAQIEAEKQDGELNTINDKVITNEEENESDEESDEEGNQSSEDI